MAKLKDMLGNQATDVQESKTAVRSFKSNPQKNKMISAYVDIEKYNKF